MGKATPDAILDAMADAIIAVATTEWVTSAEPADYAGIAAVALADVTIDSGDFTKSNGDTNGRKVRISQQAAVPIDANGTATHVCLSSGTTLLYVTTCTSQVLTAGGTVTIPVWDIEVADPT